MPEESTGIIFAHDPSERRSAPDLRRAASLAERETWAFEHIHHRALSGRHQPDSPRQAGTRLGLEVEWHLVHRDDRQRLVDVERGRFLEQLELPAGFSYSIEPGGQLELNSPPADDYVGLLDAIERIERNLVAAARACDLALLPIGHRGGTPRRILERPRYALMEAAFDRRGPAGRRMMCNTAALQLNLDAGVGAEADARWMAAHAVGPVLSALFANSPSADGTIQCSRQHIWQRIDPSRTAPVAGEQRGVAWADYALDAELLYQLCDTGDRVPAPPHMTLRDWLAEPTPPSWRAIDEHLTTLFPPIRPRGWFELRMIDALPALYRRVAVMVTSSVLIDPAARLGALDAVSFAPSWGQCAVEGVRNHAIADAGATLCLLAADSWERRTDDRSGAEIIRSFGDEYPRRRRSPGDAR